MPTKIESELTHEQFAQFCERLLGLPGKRRTLSGVQALAREYGISVSPMGAKSFKDGPFSRYLQKLEKARAGTEALVAAAGAGIHPLDALEEAMVLELQDTITSGGPIDVKSMVAQLGKLRASISLRENSRRQQSDLERRLADSESHRAVADTAIELANQRVKKLEREAKIAAEKCSAAKAVLDKVAARKGLTKETLQRIEEAAALL